MPFYTIITQDGSIPGETRSRIAGEVTRIHCTIMKVPASFVHIVFLNYPEGSGFTAGTQADTAALNCVLRSGHTKEEKADLLKQLWAMFQRATGIATEQIAMSLQEIPASNAMEMGQIMQGVGEK